MFEDMKGKIVEHIDTIALLSAAVIALILEYIGSVPNERIYTIILLVLCLLAIHTVRRHRIIEENNSRLREIKAELEEIKSSVGFRHTSSSDENWEKVITMAKR